MAEDARAIAQEAAETDQRNPLPFATEADLVMKGGITSGIVYPLAIVEISKAFRLRNIGGTSVGALAAAAAAAAEVGRQRARGIAGFSNPNGFDRLHELPNLLEETPEGSQIGTRLYAMFKPEPALKRLFEALATTLPKKGLRNKLVSGIKALLVAYPITALIGAVVGAVPMIFMPMGAATLPAFVWLTFLAAFLGVIAVLVRAGILAVHELPRNGFGFCSGMWPEDDPAHMEALTPWLAEYLDLLSGQKDMPPTSPGATPIRKPLTFGDLQDQDINLEMITTCLTFGRPFRLPFRDDTEVRENKQFYYMEHELRRVLPAYVVDWMKANQRPMEGREIWLNKHPEYLRLPEPKDTPVVFAARLSLSFPLLLSAIRLYAVDFTVRKPRDQREPSPCWFTDGGISSNFPIHFFDSALPRRPTFGFDLGVARNEDDKRVMFPTSNADSVMSTWHTLPKTGLKSIITFLLAIVESARSWSHETLSHLPGFRDRIGTVMLTEDEGGLNLTMDRGQILRITGYGTEAGHEFVKRFGNPLPFGLQQEQVMNWENHQLIRLRNLLATIAELTGGMNESVGQLTGTNADYARFFNTPYGATTYRLDGLGLLGRDPSTNLPMTQAGLGHEVYQALLAVGQLLAATKNSFHTPPTLPLSRGAPRPPPELKPRPRI